MVGSVRGGLFTQSHHTAGRVDLGPAPLTGAVDHEITKDDDIIAQRTTGNKVLLAKYIRGTRQAETVIAEIRRAMGEPDR